jgi:hypothetical protein
MIDDLLAAKANRLKIFLLVVLFSILINPILINSNTIANAQNSELDTVPPLVKITNPSPCLRPIHHVGDFVFEGIASDEGGIKGIRGFIHTLPFNDEFQELKSATPINPDDWSKWSIEITIPDEQEYRFLVEVTDNLGNENWAEVRINSPFTNVEDDIFAIEQNKTRIAFVDPTFTNGAYNEDSFYFFYTKYKETSPTQKITTDLNLLTGEVSFNPNTEFFMPLFEIVQKFSPDSHLSIIGDDEIHNGKIFQENKNNAYQALFLLHDEYVTQESYDNLQQFVKNGGVLVLLDSNIFYAEVIFNEKDCTVTLVKGHDWEFDGDVAKMSVSERYADENTRWMGSNFIINDIKDRVIFENNPFNYTHFEENHLTNTNAEVLIDYGAKFALEGKEKNPLLIEGLLKNEITYSDQGMTVATYDLQSGNGKVIMMGLYGQKLTNNPEFQTFFEKIVLPRALSQNYKLIDNGEEFNIYWKMDYGKITNIELDKETKSLVIDVDTSDESEPISENNNLLITIPKNLVDAPTFNNLADFKVYVDENQVKYFQTSDDIERSFEIPLLDDSRKIKISGTIIMDALVDGEQNNEGGCLIATATFGSELAPQVQQLRELRDNTILSTQSGVAFMTGFNQLYYSFSPIIADFERENPIFKEAVKLAITPMLTSLSILNYVDIDSEQEMLGYGIGVILMNVGIYFVAPGLIISRFTK